MEKFLIGVLGIVLISTAFEWISSHFGAQARPIDGMWILQLILCVAVLLIGPLCILFAALSKRRR